MHRYIKAYIVYFLFFTSYQQSHLQYYDNSFSIPNVTRLILGDCQNCFIAKCKFDLVDSSWWQVRRKERSFLTLMFYICRLLDILLNFRLCTFLKLAIDLIKAEDSIGYLKLNVILFCNVKRE